MNCMPFAMRRNSGQTLPLWSTFAKLRRLGGKDLDPVPILVNPEVDIWETKKRSPMACCTFSSSGYFPTIWLQAQMQLEWLIIHLVDRVATSKTWLRPLVHNMGCRHLPTTRCLLKKRRKQRRKGRGRCCLQSLPKRQAQTGASRICEEKPECRPAFGGRRAAPKSGDQRGSNDCGWTRSGPQILGAVFAPPVLRPLLGKQLLRQTAASLALKTQSNEKSDAAAYKK